MPSQRLTRQVFPIYVSLPIPTLPQKVKKISPSSKGRWPPVRKPWYPTSLPGRQPVLGMPCVAQCTRDFSPSLWRGSTRPSRFIQISEEPARIAHLELFLFSPTNFLFCYCYWYCYCYCYCYCGNYLFLSSGRIRVIVIERQSRYSPLGEQSPSVCFEHSSAVINIGLLNIIDIFFSFFHESKSTTKSKRFFCAFANFSKEKGRRTKYLQRFNKKN